MPPLTVTAPTVTLLAVSPAVVSLLLPSTVRLPLFKLLLPTAKPVFCTVAAPTVSLPFSSVVAVAPLTVALFVVIPLLLILVLVSILVVVVPVVSRLIPAVSAVPTPSALMLSTVVFSSLTSTPPTL